MPQSAVVLKCLNVYGGPTREEVEMFCSKCGAANLDEYKFCASCGNPLQTVGAVTEHKHSGVGIASFIMGIAAIVLTVLLIIVAGAMNASTSDGLDDNAVVVVGGCGVALMALGIVALSLGIVGLFQKDRRKMFPILGTVLSSVMLFGIGRSANHGILLRGGSGVRCRGAPFMTIWG
jgi:hypothetical protein